MSETPPPAATADRLPPPGLTADPGTRGRLRVADKVAARIATIAAGQVAGVVRSGSGAGAVFGRQYPDVSAQVAGDHVRVSVYIAIRWPTPADVTAATVRDRVRRELNDYAGLTADTVDVTVAAIEPPAADHGRTERNVQ